MKLLIPAFISLFFTCCFAELLGNSFCSGGVFYRWDSKAGCRCDLSNKCSVVSGQQKVLTAASSYWAGENCYKQFKNNKVCKDKCIQTFGFKCFYSDEKRVLYKEVNGRNANFCKANFGTLDDCR